jgi:hypothetical protein
MRFQRLKKYAIGAGGMLVLVMTILLATGWGVSGRGADHKRLCHQ